MGFLADPAKSTSDTVSHVGQVVASSPIAQAVISGGLAIATGGASIPYTAAAMGVNQVAQGGDLGAGLLAAGGSYLAGTGAANYASTGSVFGQGGASGLLGGTGGAAAGATAAEQGAANALIAQGYSPSAAWEVVNAGGAGVASTAGAGAAGSTAGGLLSGAANSSNLLSGSLGMAGSYLNARSAQDAAQTQADAQIRAAQIAADAAKFRPIGVTTNFGRSQFGYDSNGNLNSAGYALSPQLQAQQNQIMGASGGLLNQFTGAQAATAPMGQAAQSAMTLGNGYLTTDPQAQAAKYYADQQAILAPGRASTMADLQATMQAQGRGGFAIGGGVGGQGAANPQLMALLNANNQQDTTLAANATQGGMDYAKFGAGMVGTGGDMLKSMYGTQSAAYSPYQTALGGAQTIEGLGQQALTQGMALGSTTTAANAQAGGLLAGGINNAAATMAPANAYSPWGAMLSGAGQATAGYKFDPMTGKAL